MEAARELGRGGDVIAALARVGISLEELIHAHRRFTARMLVDEELAAKFQKAMGGGPG